jgi:hypothetical protein
MLMMVGLLLGVGMERLYRGTWSLGYWRIAKSDPLLRGEGLGADVAFGKAAASRRTPKVLGVAWPDQELSGLVIFAR